MSKNQKAAVSLDDAGLSSDFDFVGGKTLNPQPCTLDHAIPFNITNAIKMRTKKEGVPEDTIAHTVEFQEDGETVRRLYTLKPNTPRLRFIEHFEDGKGPIGPVLLWKKIIDPKKKPGTKQNEVWLFKDPSFKETKEYREAVAALPPEYLIHDEGAAE